MINNTPSRALTGVASLVQSYGHDPDAIARRVGLAPSALYRPDLFIEGGVFNDYLEEAALVCDDRFFSLKLAPIQGWHLLGPVWQLIRRAKTVGEVLRVIAAHLESYASTISSPLVEDERGISISLEARWDPKWGRGLNTSRVQVVELACAIFMHEMRRLLGTNWRAEQVRFRHSTPENPRPLYQVFGDKLSFNQDANAIHVSKADCERSIAIMADRPTFSPQYETPNYLQWEIPFVLEVDRAIRLLLNGDEASVDRVADSLGISPRTLQHKLRQSDTTYQRLFDIARIDLALEYLNDSDLNVLAISERVGFTDAAAFSRFFKKHLKMSPREYSKRIRQGAA
ncbi:AraC family transcriptional regulator [Halioglobus maricola]|uniref:AraC family transcriptional regulator n=1 Tax=Halioglobus maricola TaxID=2601894 RepID=A0A5P9NL56_9GAMM|nr:AraC family transcriptional regulator [Halioglobus maricola]QFU76245.1 AraC family transcriptional regulator [Halioglobus maricola]